MTKTHSQAANSTRQNVHIQTSNPIKTTLYNLIFISLIQGNKTPVPLFLRLEKHVPLHVRDDNAVCGLGDVREDLSLLFNVDDRSTIGRDVRPRRSRGIRIGKVHGTKIGESNKFSVLLIVLDNPLGILLAKRGS